MSNFEIPRCRQLNIVDSAPKFPARSVTGTIEMADVKGW